jgi:uracil-DNA glycosylase family 4
MSRCENCPNKTQRAVPGTLHGGCDILVVGEGPGKVELQQGKPFVGPSGELLWKTFAKAGLGSELKVSVTNATCCGLPKGEKISPQMVAACKGRLHAEIKAERPKVIVALGNTALRAVSGEGLKITEVQGQAYPNVFGAIMIPALHPAALLRGTGDYKKFQSALTYAVQLAAGQKGKDPGKTQYRVVQPHEVEKVIDGLIKCERLGADIETTGFNPRKDKITCLGIAWAKNKVLVFKPESLAYLRRLFAAEKPKWWWHNGKFDTKFLRALGFPARVDGDCMLMHYSLTEVRGTHDLKQLSGEYLGADPHYDREYEEWTKKFGYEYVPDAILHPYNAKDCDYTLQLSYALEAELAKEPADLHKMYQDLLLPAAEMLQEVEQNGMWVDRCPPGECNMAPPEEGGFDCCELNRVRWKMREQSKKAEDHLLAVVAPYWDPHLYCLQSGAKKPPKEFNCGSWQQLHWLLYTVLKLKPPKGFKQNTREETLLRLPSNPVTDALIQFREAEKALNTFVDALDEQIEDDRRARTTYLLHGTVTGRLASKPNRQNIPRSKLIRGMYQAAPGHKLVELDYNQAELRVLAILSGDKELLRIYREGRKLHHEVATTMYGDHFGGSQDLWNEQQKTWYIRAKAVNFGIVYGRQAQSLAKEFKISDAEAQGLIDAWFARFPEAQRFINLCRSIAKKGKALRSPLGRQRRFNLVTSENEESVQNEAANFPIQSTASDFTLLAACAMLAGLKRLQAKIINLVHDSILIEVPDDEDLICRVAQLGVETMQMIPVPIVGDAIDFIAEVKVGTKWGSLKEMEVAAR